MIINIRGTHGSGKTTLVRRLMKEFRRCKPIFIDGRRQPIGYECDRSVFIVGHYEGDASGGCDTIPKVDLMYKWIRRYAKRGYAVIFEGILAQHNATRLIALRDQGFVVRVIQIQIPLKKAIRSVKRRRRARGNRRAFNPANVIRENRALQSSANRLRTDGVRVAICDTRRAASNRVRALLEKSR
jgi:predicted ABC-type ATPase